MKSLPRWNLAGKARAGNISKPLSLKPKTPDAQPVWHKIGHLIGNQALGRLIQAKLTVGAPDDQYEQEADRIADQIMAIPQSGIQRQAEPEEEEEELEQEAIQTKPFDMPITPRVQRQAEEEEADQPKPASNASVPVTFGLQTAKKNPSSQRIRTTSA